MTTLYNPWKGKSIEEIRAMEYARSPGMKPLEAPQAATPTAGAAAPVQNAKALAYLKEYVGQMRAAGFSDVSIRQKLIKTGSIFIPDKLPANFGQTGPWAKGMLAEFGQVNTVPQTLEGNIPSPNEYLNYMPGNTANRLPASYGEFTGSEQPPFFNPGKFQQTKITNLGRAEQNYIAGYKGPKIGASQYGYEAGIVGLPQEQGQQFYQDFVSLAQQKADEAKKQTDYENLVMNYPEIQFTPGATVEENATKVAQYKELMQYQEDLKKQQPDFKTKLKTDFVNKQYNLLIEAFTSGVNPTQEQIMTEALKSGIELTQDEAYAILNAALQKASENTGG